MGWKQLIDSNLLRAFNLVKDLAVDATFVQKSGTTFNFNSVAVNHASTVNKQAKVVALNTETTYKDKTMVTKMIMFKSRDVGDVSAYDKVILAGETWSIGDLVKSNGYIYVFAIHKGV
jgi:hypothetical protein